CAEYQAEATVLGVEQHLLPLLATEPSWDGNDATEAPLHRLVKSNARLYQEITVHSAKVVAELLGIAHPQQHHGLLTVGQATDRRLRCLHALHALQQLLADELRAPQWYSQHSQAVALDAHCRW